MVRAQSTWRSICWRSSSRSAATVRNASPDAFARTGIDAGCELEPVDHLAECSRGAGHQRRVGRQRDGQDEGAAGSGRKGQLLGLLHCGDLAREYELDVGVAVGDPGAGLSRTP